ncbi:MAG: hypothetical protein JF605_21685 [Burkholderia sp.]|nr:hypothetical protein [Burkholderia sp.]
MMEHPSTSSRQDAALWLSLLGAPVIWLVQFQCNYSLVLWACAHHCRWIIPVVSVLGLLLTVATGWLAWKLVRESGPGKVSSDEKKVQARRHFMACLALCCSLLFFLVTLAQGVATTFFHPCVDYIR